VNITEEIFAIKWSRRNFRCSLYYCILCG